MDTKTENNRKSEIILSLIGIFILILAVVGISYAVWSRTFEGTKENSLKTGNLSFSYSEVNNSYILLENALPISDKQGKELNGDRNVFDFNISASYDSSTRIKYDIFTEPVGNNTLPEEYVKVYLTDQSNIPIDGYNRDIVPTYDSLKNYDYNGKTNGKLLYSSYMTSSNSTKKYRLRIWVASDFADGTNQYDFSFKVNVKGSI